MPQRKLQLKGDTPGRPLAARLADKRALRASEARYRALVAASAQVVWITTPEGLLDDASEWGALTGQSPEQSRGMGWTEALHPDDRPRVLRLWAEALRLRRLFETEYRVRMRDGSYRLFASRGVPVFDERGAVREWVGTAVDVTESRQAEDERLELLARERQARAAAEAAERRQAALAEVARIFSQSPLDLDLTLHQIAYHCAELLADCCLVYLLAGEGLDAAQTVVFPEPLACPVDRSLIDGVLAAGLPLLVPALPEPPSGGPALRSLLIVPLRAQGRVFGALAVGRVQQGQPYTFEEQTFLSVLADRAAQALDRALLYAVQQRARAAAERAAERLTRLQRVTSALSRALTPEQVAEVIVAEGVAALDADAGLVALVDQDGQRLEIASAAGYPPDEIARYRTFQLADNLPLAQVARLGEPIWWEQGVAMVERYPLLNGFSPAHRPDAFVGLPLHLGGRVVGVFALRFGPQRSFAPEERSLMLTLVQQGAQALERARLHRAAEEAVRMRDVFFSIAAHELKSPLTALLGQAQLLQRRAAREALLAEREVRTLATLVAQAHRLNKLVLAMLDISRIEQGQLALERAPLDLAELARRVVEELQPCLERHALRLDLPRTPLPVCGDALRLEQVLQNLLSNAVKYSPEGGPVELRLWSEGGRAAVAVRDCGIGIPPAAIPHLFARFYRAANTEARNISGLGIGLYVVREIVELHGGRIDVESAEGGGSTFTVWLPLEG